MEETDVPGTTARDSMLWWQFASMAAATVAIRLVVLTVVAIEVVLALGVLAMLHLL
jgi:hypothetical protein